MRIQILGLNYAPEPIGIATYTTGLAEALADRGHEVRIVSAKPYYPQWRVQSGYRRPGWIFEHKNGVAITRVPLYVPRSPSGNKRIVHHASFAAASVATTLKQAVTFRPDVVMAVAPSLIAAPVARLAARVCGARSWLHIQDFEIEAAFATGLLGAGGVPARAAFRFQRRTVTSFDVVSSISSQMCAKLLDVGVAADRITELRNWADLSRVKVLNRPSIYRAEWRITTPHVALYSGNIANKQGIEIIVDAAHRLANRDDITFVICGEGPSQDRLIARAANLTNICFKPLQPIDRLGELLGLASIHLLPQLAGAADLVLPSKLTNMLASGRPTVATAEPGTSLSNEVADCGLITPPGDVDRFARAITFLIDDPMARASYGANARFRASERWSHSSIIGRFEKQLLDLVDSGAIRDDSRSKQL